jgi:hypothetical protein
MPMSTMYLFHPSILFVVLLNVLCRVTHNFHCLSKELGPSSDVFHVLAAAAAAADDDDGDDDGIDRCLMSHNTNHCRMNSCHY